jgi:hypothetical protein
LTREEWAKPRGRKSHRRRCGSGDRGVAALRPDQAMRGKVLAGTEEHLWEKTWRISVGPRKKPSFSGSINEALACRQAGCTSAEPIEEMRKSSRGVAVGRRGRGWSMEAQCGAATISQARGTIRHLFDNRSETHDEQPHSPVPGRRRNGKPSHTRRNAMIYTGRGEEHQAGQTGDGCGQSTMSTIAVRDRP